MYYYGRRMILVQVEYHFSASLDLCSWFFKSHDAYFSVISGPSFD